MRRKLLTAGVLVSLVVIVGLALTMVGAFPGGTAPSYAETVKATSTMVSGIQVMNQSSSVTATITIDFYNQSGTKVTSKADTIAPSASKSYYTPSITTLTNGFIGSAVVSSDEPVVAILNTQTPSGAGVSSSDPFRIGSSSGVKATSTTLYFPQVERHYYNWNSSMYVQNTTSSSATVIVQFISSNG